MIGIFFNQGEVCSAGFRDLNKQVYDEVLQTVVKQARSIHQGPGVVPGTRMAPPTAPRIREAIRSALQAGVRKASVPPQWDGHAAGRIVDVLLNRCGFSG